MNDRFTNHRQVGAKGVRRFSAPLRLEMTRFHHQLVLGLSALMIAFAQPAPAGAAVEHVVVIGVDGLGAEGVRQAEAPTMRRLMKSGAWTLKARAVRPTSSSPNWASMIMGAGPDRHGVTSNQWQPYRYDVAPVAVGSGGIFPTIFGVLREQRPWAKIAVFHDWQDFGRLLETNAPNVLKHVKDALETCPAAIEYLKEQKPQFLFIHFDGVDHAGHGFGWNSPQYQRAVELVDSLVAAILAAVQEAGIQDSTAVLLTADHGGKGRKHGGDSLEELEIPWILSGPGIARGKQLTATVNTYDTAPTLARLFGVKAPAAWIGRPVEEAFAVRTAR
jgi:predicted AlkP superfamily pyrophosphatase or phosphodiesterase